MKNDRRHVEFAGETSEKLMIASLWAVLMFVVGLWTFAFFYLDGFDGAPMILSLIALIIAFSCLLIRTVTGKAWRLAAMPGARFEYVQAAWALALGWHRIARASFEQVRDGDIWWLPGIRRIYMSEDGLCLEVKLPPTKVANRILTEPAEDGSFASNIPVDQVVFKGRRMDTATYLVIPKNHTNEVTEAQFD